MAMTELKISKTLLTVILTSTIATDSAYTENNAQTTNESVGQKVDSSMNKVGNSMGDNAITTEVKTVLVNRDNIKSIDISVKTDRKIVTLNGFTESQTQTEEAVRAAKDIEGVISVSDELRVRDAKEDSTKGYVGDTTITSEIKVKLLVDDVTPSRHVKVETTDSMVQLPGVVDSQVQGNHAESIAKAVDDMKSARNNPKTK